VHQSLEVEGDQMMVQGILGQERVIGDVPVGIIALGGVILAIDVVSQSKVIDPTISLTDITMDHAIDNMMIDTGIGAALLEGDDDLVYQQYGSRQRHTCLKFIECVTMRIVMIKTVMKQL
jgi:hypothetical protein